MAIEREVFIVQNVSTNDVEVQDFGLIIPVDVSIDLGDFDDAVLSGELFNYLEAGDLVRLIDGSIVLDLNVAYQSTTQTVGGVSQAYVDGSLATNYSYMDGSLNVKANQIYVDASLNIRPTFAYVDASLNLKSDLTYVNSEFSILDASVVALENNKVNRSGDTMTGDLIVTGIDITNDLSIGNSLHVNNDVIILGNTQMKGNFLVDGSTTFMHTDTLEVSTNFINLNTGLTGTPPAILQSGIIIERGNEDPYIFIFDEDTQAFRIGIASADASGNYSDASTQAVSTREDNPTDTGVSFWNEDLWRFETSPKLTFEPSTLFIDTSLHVTGNIVPSQRIKFAAYDNIDPSYGELWVDPSYGHLYFYHNIEMHDASSYDLVDRLTRSANDWGLFPDSSTLDTGDRILIEDAQDGFKKKWIGAEAFAESVTGGFGLDADYIDNLPEQSTTSTTYVNALTLVTDASAKAGTYRIGWSIQVANSKNGKVTGYRILVDSSINLIENTVIMSVANTYTAWAAFQAVDLPAGSHTIEIDYLAALGSTAYLKNLRLEFWRTSKAT